MKLILRLSFSLFFIILSCSEEEPAEKSDRFFNSLKSATEAGTLTQVTEEGRSIFPFFANDDTLIIYKQLLTPSINDALSAKGKTLTEYFAINPASGDFFELKEPPQYPMKLFFPREKAPAPNDEFVTVALLSPDSVTVAFETILNPESDLRTIYLFEQDSLTQLSYGDKSCFLARFSNTGRYLTAVLGNGPTWIIIYDLWKRQIYKIDNPEGYLDYQTTFSSDDKYMVFIRSEAKVSDGMDFFGDIWVLEFSN